MLSTINPSALDAEAAEIWGTDSTVDSLVKFVEAVSKYVPEILKKEDPIEE